jgi:hypothetical protein
MFITTDDDGLGRSAVQAVSCGFVNNTALNLGGALYISGLAQVNLTGQTRATGNQAGDRGGFANLGQQAVLQTTDGEFAHNSVGSRGHGGLVSADGQAAVVFRGCRVQGSLHMPGVFGGVFNIDHNATLSIASCTFARIHAGYGACIAALGNSSVKAHDCFVANCTAAVAGGGLLVNGGHVSWVGGTFRNMRAQDGAAIDIYNGTLNLAGNVFVNGTATAGGGAITAENTARVVLHHCSMHDCTSVTNNGGALMVTDSAQVHLADCNISWCSSKEWAGGALAAQDNSSVQLHRCLFHHNKATTCGGAIVVQGGAAHVVLTQCSITDNACAMGGGGVCARDDTSVQLRNSVVVRNVASYGGGVWLGEHAAIGMANTRVELNNATWGGGIYLDSGNFSVAQVRKSVHANTALYGDGDMSVTATALVNTNSSTIEGFVCRLGAVSGLLNVSLLVAGHQGLPSEARTVHAILDGVVVSQGVSGADGIVNMQTKLRCLQVWQHATLSRSNFSFGTIAASVRAALVLYTARCWHGTDKVVCP